MNKKTAIFGIGCFWGVQKFFDQVDGVIETTVGYAGGIEQDPRYRESKDHSEVIKIVYNEEKISYEELVNLAFEKRDPTMPEYKKKYKTLIMYSNNSEKDTLDKILEKKQNNESRELNVKIQEISDFYKAEEYHQKYFEKQEI